MQPNTIVLPVDYLNTGVTTDETYRRIEEFQNRALYAGPSHTLLQRDTLALYRTANKRSGNFHGVAKVAGKFTLDVEVPGVDSTTTVTAPAIGEVNFAIPVGVSSADKLKIRQRILALIDMDAIMNPLMDHLEI